MYIGHNDIERYCKTVIIICIHLCRNFIQFVKVTRFFKYMYMIFNFGQSVKTKLLKLSRQNSRAAFFSFIVCATQLYNQIITNNVFVT